MNKLSRERVKNTFKWIYVQPTSSSLEIDGLGTVLNCVLFSSPHPAPQRTGCRRAREAKAFHFVLVGAGPPESPGLHLFDGRGTLVQVRPGAGEVRVAGCQRMCLHGWVLPNFPWLAPLRSVKPKCVCNENRHRGCLLSPATQAHSLERGGGSGQLVFWRSPEETEKGLPTALAQLNNNELQVQCK